MLNIGGTSAITGLDASASPNEVHYTSTAANQTIKAPTSAYHHLFVEKSGRIGTLAAATTVNGNLSVTAGSLADGGFQITGNATGTFSLAAGTTLTLGLAAAATSFPTAFTTGNTTLNATSTVNYNATSAQTISDVQGYGNLTTTGAATKTAAGALTVNGSFNVTAGTFADGGFTITLKDGCTMTGTHTGAGKILFTGGSAIHSVTGAGYNNVELDDSNGVLLAGTTTIGGTLTITSGTWDVDARTLTVVGPTTVSGTLLISSVTGVKTFDGTTITNGGVIQFTAAEAMTMNGDLTVNGTGTITGTSGIWTFSKVGGGTIGGTATSLTIAGSVTFATQYSIGFPFTVNTFTVNTGINETNTGTITINTSLAGLGTLTQSAGTILNLGGATTITTLDASVNSNEVHYTSTTAGQTVKAADYYNLFIDKSGQQATMTGTTNVLGNLTLSAGTMSIQTSTLTVTGTTTIHGILQDLNDTGITTFHGLVTVFSDGSWNNISAENAPFNFSNGLVFDGIAFTSGPGIYTFLNNNQSITGSSAVTIVNMVVTGIQLTNSNTSSVTASTSLSGTGEFIQDTNATLNIGGTSTLTTLTATASGNTVNYNGGAAQTVHAGTYQTLTVDDNTSGNVDITADAIANTALDLGATIFSTSTNKMVMGPGATVSRTTGFINGNFQKNVPMGSPLRTFEVGSGADYTPIDVSFNGVTVSGDLLVNTTPSDHASISFSQLQAGKTVNRFYTATNGGVSFGTYDATFTFVPTDVDFAANTANFILEKFNSGTWSRPTLGTVTATTVSVAGVTSFSDFQIGETVSAPTPTPDSDSGSSSGSLIGGFTVAAPLIDVVQVSSPLALLAGPGPVTYTYTIVNIGAVSVANLTIVDDTCSPLVFASGDTDGDAQLDTTETWTFTCQTNLTQTTTNIATVTGQANGLTTTDVLTSTVLVVTLGLPNTGAPGLPNTGFPPAR